MPWTVGGRGNTPESREKVGGLLKRGKDIGCQVLESAPPPLLLPLSLRDPHTHTPQLSWCGLLLPLAQASCGPLLWHPSKLVPRVCAPLATPTYTIELSHSAPDNFSVKQKVGSLFVF